MEKKKGKYRLLVGGLLVALTCTALLAIAPAPSTAHDTVYAASKSTSFDWDKNYNYYDDVPYPGTPQTIKIYAKRNMTDVGSFCYSYPCKHMVPRVYTSQEDAAKDFGMTYGKWSIRHKKEVGSMIFKLGERQFVMTLATVGDKNSVYPNFGCMYRIDYESSLAVSGDAIIHAHGAEGWLDYKEKLSGPDMAFSARMSKKVPVPIYVTTPWGSLKRAYGDPNKESYYAGGWFTYAGWMGYKNETVASNMPHDRTSDGQALKFKHWFGKKCSDCAQK